MNRVIHKGIAILILAFCFSLYACATATVTPEMVKENLSVWVPLGDGPFPVVIYYQGTGAHDRRSWKWAKWFDTLGVASAIVSNAHMRNRRNNPSGSRYAEDGAIVWDILKDNPQIDTSRFALMGFSRGGGMALMAGRHFKNKRVKPNFIFALYPGGWGGRDTCLCSHAKPTEVHIFYGDSDDVEKYTGYRSACRSLARSRDNIEFHLLKGAEHGYDDDVFPFTFYITNGQPCEVKYSAEAVEKTKSVIEKTIKAAWNL